MAANSSRADASSFRSTAASAAVGVRLTHWRKAQVARAASDGAALNVRQANQRAAWLKVGSFNVVSAWSGVFDRLRRTQLCSAAGVSNISIAGYGTLRFQKVYIARR